MVENKITEDMLRELYSTVARLKTPDDCKALFEDLCTFKELEQMAQRITAAKLLLEGKTYAQVNEITEISSATLSRVSRSIQHGSGGYKKFIKIK